MNGGTIKADTHKGSQAAAIQEEPPSFALTVLYYSGSGLDNPNKMCVRECNGFHVLNASLMSSADEQLGEAYKHLKSKMCFWSKCLVFYTLCAMNVLSFDINRTSHGSVSFDPSLGKHRKSTCEIFVHC